MPTYAYRCPSCAHAFERFHKMTETAPQSCPECGTAAQRVITGGAGLVFKGSGFYITDYKKSGGKEGEAKDGKGAKDDKGAAAKTEPPKPDAGKATSKKSAGDDS